MSADSDRERRSQEDKQNVESQVKDILQKGLEGKHQNYGAALYTGSLTEADASPVAAKNNDGIDLIPVDATFPKGFATTWQSHRRDTVNEDKLFNSLINKK